MSDPRETPFNGRVAHISMEGQVDAESYVEGEAVRVRRVLADLKSAPDGPRERQLLFGEAFLALDLRDHHVFGIAERDGYVGWVRSSDLDPGRDLAPATHRVSARLSYAKRSPDLKATEPPVFVSHGTRLPITDIDGDWARADWALKENGEVLAFYLPSQHIAPLEEHEPDPVTVARRFLGTPYLWGGNSAFGIDCSGLVQAAMLTCGIPCPGDSDQQRDRLGEALPGDADTRVGDIIFWKGHVGIVSSPETLLHATAHYMSVVEEPLDEAIQRIENNEGLKVLSRRRVTPPSE